MSCTICGGEFLYGGGDTHARCREIEVERTERDKRIDALLELHKYDIEVFLNK